MADKAAVGHECQGEDMVWGQRVTTASCYPNTFMCSFYWYSKAFCDTLTIKFNLYKKIFVRLGYIKFSTTDRIKHQCNINIYVSKILEFSLAYG